MKGTICYKKQRQGEGSMKQRMHRSLFPLFGAMRSNVNTGQNLLSKNGRYDDGNYLQSSYIITTEDMNVEAITIRLTDSRGKVVCEKERSLALQFSKIYNVPKSSFDGDTEINAKGGCGMQQSIRRSLKRNN